MKNNLLAMALTALLAACSTTPKDEPAQAAAADDGLVCVKEGRVGTMFRTSVCRTAEQVEQNRADVRQWENARIRPGTTREP